MNWGSRTQRLSTFGVGHSFEWPSPRMMEMFDKNQDPKPCTSEILQMGFERLKGLHGY